MQNKIRNFYKNFYKDRTGATVVEYAIILGLIVFVCYTTINLLNGNISNFFTSVANTTNASGNNINGSVTVT